jgi:hypothetical protein
MSTEITVKNRAGVPAISDPERIEREIATLTEVFRPIHLAAIFDTVELPEPATLARAESWAASGAPGALIRRLDALDGPANRDNIASALLLLTAAFPNTSSRDLNLYAQLLSEDVKDAAPGKLALDLACRRLRRTSRFLPAISEVLDAIATATKQIEGARCSIAKLPETLSEVRRRIEQAKSWRQWLEERQRRDEEKFQAYLRQRQLDEGGRT